MFRRINVAIELTEKLLKGLGEVSHKYFIKEIGQSLFKLKLSANGGSTMNKKVAILALIVLPTLIFAQTSGKISGIVTDENGVALGGANVLLVGTSQGTATDADGQYYVLDVPVGDYSVRVQYIGYVTHTIDNVHVSADLTTWLDYRLTVAALEGEEVTVTAEKPIINLNATNTNRIIDAETIANLPIRNVQNLVNLQTGVVDGHVRGSRTGDNAYYVDGVLVRNQWNGGNITNGISRSGTQEISVQTGGFSAEYGSANGGVVNITSKSGGNTWSGSVEYVTDLGSTDGGTNKNGLYSFGYNLLNFDMGGPITNKIRLYLNVEQMSSLDNEPAFITHPEADVFEISGGALDSSLIFVYDAVDSVYTDRLKEGNIYYEPFRRMNQTNPDSLVWANYLTSWGEGLNIDSVAKYRPGWVDTTHLYANNYSQKYGPRRNVGEDKLAITGNIVLDLKPLRIKVGGSVWNREEYSNNSTYQLLNWENMPLSRTGLNLGYVNGTLSLSPKSLLRSTVSLKSYYFEEYNPNFKHDVDAYGVRSTDIGSDNYYYRDHGLNTLGIPALVGFGGYGQQWNRSIERYENTLGIRTDYLNQIGRHEFKTGFEYYNTEVRYYRVSQSREIFQQLDSQDRNFNGVLDVDPETFTDANGNGAYDDGETYVDANSNGIYDLSELTAYDSKDEWEYFVYRNAYTYNIGYDIFGKETDKYEFDTHGQEPGLATTTRLFVTDKIEYRDVILNLGVSYETFDPNTFGPDSDDDGNADDAGFDNLHLRNGRIHRDGDGTFTHAGIETEIIGSNPWEAVEKYTAIQPRLGFSFPVTEKTVFHAQYGKYWQPPPLAYLYLSDSRLAANLTQGNQTASPNPTLRPERTTSYEIGFTQQMGLNAALDITGFYKEVRDYVMLKNRGDEEDVDALVDGSEFSWAQYMNGDFGVTQGFAFNVRMRRTHGVMANFNYTTMWARGTGSDPLSNWNITWTGDAYPTIINRLEYDQRHTGSLMVDWRADSRNPLLAHLGFNALLTFGSGQAYTPSYDQSAIYGRGWWTPTAAVNSGDLPWRSQLDLRLDKGFEFGNIKLNAYVLVINALAKQNESIVYESSGEAGEDGYMQTDNGVVWLNSQTTLYPDAPAASLYTDRLNGFQDATLDPVRYDLPRMVRFGLQVQI